MNLDLFGPPTGELLQVPDVGVSELSLLPSVLAPHLSQVGSPVGLTDDAELTAYLGAVLELAIQGFEVPEVDLEGPISPPMKWRYSSAYQKAVRRNDPSLASAAIQLNKCDPGYIWRRAPTIAFEDVAMGDPWVCALVLTACRFSRFRNQYGADKLAIFLGQLMGKAVKDRLACDSFCLPLFDPELKDARFDVQKLSLQDRLDLYRSDATPFVWRVMAGMTAAGSRYGFDVFTIDDGVNRRPKGTPYRRAKGTPFEGVRRLSR